ncbi:NAD dependent epimerase/dehydratase [Lindgomyces ingoldianus]|uniref:NAD dependent epimerase/dehydratase n=1 Tax=Lindgomyces ingoldianus TaxID=673940 RepID=A0ACB6RD55_9PLEO|nr:NAD dependent epimerase/dehydratase [Lindgomyces ingoldianus]KAF2477032.1 NAD dependent epimerase/dehydratase [Lindgomyces ingoldianus]
MSLIIATHRILLTDTNSFVASHILSQLLRANHSVRAVVWSLSKADAVKALFASYPSSSLDCPVVPDMTIPGAFDSDLQSNPPFDIVMHTASPFLYKTTDVATDFLDPAIKGTTEILEGINRVAVGSVTRVILTSSFAAVGVYTEEDWNPFAYRASEKFAEKAEWQEVKKKGPKEWDLVVLNPPMVYGPSAHKNLFLSEKNATETEVPPNRLPLYVDVRDLAHAHVLAMDASSTSNQRFLVTAGAVTSQEISDIFRKEVLGTLERPPKGIPGTSTLLECAFSADATKVKTMLRLEFRSKKETFASLGIQLLEIEEKKEGEVSSAKGQFE